MSRSELDGRQRLRTRAGGTLGRLECALAIGVLVAGCDARVGAVAGLLGPEVRPPVMILATGVEGRDCDAAWFRLPPPDGSLARALAVALSSVPDATLLTDAEVATETLATGVYNRRCVRVRGSAARMVREVVVPMPEGQAHHH